MVHQRVAGKAFRPQTQTPPVVQQNNTSKAVEYKGKVPELVKGMLDVPHGGQIIMDGRAFQGIKGELTTLAALVPPHPDWDSLERQRRHGVVLGTGLTLSGGLLISVFIRVAGAGRQVWVAAPVFS